MKNLFLNHNKKKGVLETFVAWFMAFSLVMQGLGGLPLVAFATNDAGGTNSSSAENTSQSGNAALNQQTANNNNVVTITQTSSNEKVEIGGTVDNSSGSNSLHEEVNSQGQTSPENSSGNGNLAILQKLALNMNSSSENSPKTPPQTVPPVNAPITIVASKIVCNAESKLPNWGLGGPDIASTTATDYVRAHPGCVLTPDWKFQWGYQGVGDAGATLVGEAPNTGTSSTDWKTFGPTDTQGSTSVSIDNVDHSSVIWVREVLKDGYIPFTFDSTHQQNDNNVSAEMYCNTDVLNYDNYDYVNVPEAGHTYYCVAFNALKNTPLPPPPPTSCTVDVVSDVNDKLVGGANAVATYSANPSWTAVVPGATWIWKTFFVADPTHDETTNFTKDFVINGTVASATMTLAADNSFSASVNSIVVGSDNTEFNYFEENKHVYDVTSSLHTGTNTIAFEVKNWAQVGGSAQTNPAGLLYKLHVVYLSQNSNCTTPPPPANTPPVITLVGDNPLVVTQGSVFTDPGATSTDKEDGDLTSVIVATGTVDTSILGTTTRTYTVTDSGGLSASTTRTVIVKDIYLPPMNSCDGVYGKVISSVDGWGFHSDNTPEHYTVHDGENQPTHGDSLDNSWVHTDGQGHSITWSLSADTNTVRIFTSNDHGPYPAEFEEYNVLVSHDNVTWSAPLTASATYVGDINNVKVHDGVKDFVSTTSFRYVRLVQNGISGIDFEIDAIKSCGGATNTPPIITLIGANPLVINVNTTFVEPGANATDTEDCVGKTQAQCNTALHLTATGTVNTSVVGTYTITYNATDSQNLAATPVTRTVNVVSTGCAVNCGGGGGSGNTRPVITVLGANPFSVIQNTVFIDPGATAFDSEDGDITLRIVATGTVNTAVVGTYTVTYDVSDSQNLPAQQKSRVVNVVVAGNPGCTSNCGGGGGGGSGSPSLSITNEKLTVTGTTTVTVTWDTNFAADSRVVYGLNSVPTLANPPYYGYQITTATDTTLTIKHTMVINGIPSAIATYFRPVSSVSSLTATGIELTRQPDAVVGGSCEYLKEYMRLGINNNPTEVTKLQLFLKNFEGFTDLAVTGFFDITTDRAVRGFQDKYKSDVLDPWDLPGNTGYVYYTTKKKVNEIYCQRAFPLNTTQLAEVASFRELIARINAQSTAAPTLPLVGINTLEGSTQGTVAGASTVKETKPFEGVTISDVPRAQAATATDNRGHIALSDLLAIPSSMSGELSDNNGTATDTGAGVVAGASTNKQGIAAVIDSLALRTHLTPLQVILVLLLLLLAIGSALFFGLTKGPEVKSVHMNIDSNN